VIARAAAAVTCGAIGAWAVLWWTGAPAEWLYQAWAVGALGALVFVWTAPAGRAR
jgi:hypothetical protein